MGALNPGIGGDEVEIDEGKIRVEPDHWDLAQARICASHSGMKTDSAQPSAPVWRTSTLGLGADTERTEHRGTASRKVRRILVPVDFSADSEAALDHALDLAEHLGAKVTLLHVIERIPYGGQLLSPLNLSDFAPSTRHMEAALTKLGRGDRRISAPMVRVGRAAEEIVAAAECSACDCIVLSPHGYSGKKEVLLGSVAEYVVRHAPCSVLLVRETDEDEEMHPHRGRPRRHRLPMRRDG
jgi:universal stress protein A